jgi:hypothetical protein
VESVRSVLLQVRAVAQFLLITLPSVEPDQPAAISAPEDHSDHPHHARALTRHLRDVGDFLEEHNPEAARAALLRARAIEQELDQVTERTDEGSPPTSRLRGMMVDEPAGYPELMTYEWKLDRPLSVQATSAGWRVTWRSGRITLYQRDPRELLRCGFEPPGEPSRGAKRRRPWTVW